MKTEPATIKDIARHLNISPSTVSRALNDHYSISQKTKEAVMKAAKEMHYQPNAIALSLLNKRTHNIGVVIPEIAQPFYAQAISGIEEVTTDAGYNVMICQSNERYDRECNVLKALVSSYVDGIIVCPAGGTTQFAHLEEVHHRGIPLVFLDRVIDAIPSSRVVSDDHLGAFTIVKHLALFGYKKIAHIVGPKQLSVSQNRLNGYLEALRRYKLPVMEEYLVYTDLTPENMRACAAKLLDLPNPPDAIFAVNDPTAMQAMHVAQSRGLNIPEQVAIAGFDNQPYTAYLNPSLTTTAQPAYEMGKKAAQLLLAHIKNPDKMPESVTFETKLIVRQSSRRQMAMV